MLKKLLKHDLKSINGVGCMMLIVMAVTTLFALLSFKSPMWEAMFSDSAYGFKFGIADLIGIIGIIFYFIIVSVMSFVFLIFLGYNFYRSMYSDRGYLTHTLPVTQSRLFLSKVLSGAIWTFVINLAMMFSFLAIIVGIINVILSGAGMEWGVFWKEFSMEWSDFVEISRTEGGVSIGSFMVVLGIFFLLSPVISVVIMFGSLTLGQLAKSARAVLGVVWYLLILFLLMLISYVISFISTLSMFTSGEYSDMMMLKDYQYTYSITLVVQLIIAVVLWIVSVKILKKKINLH
ncbi:MAG: hypothetical protein IKL04_04075 [Lachnospiraceae bacterium]|nr:hypothetical protein [Lachnospiraceae bacterium]